MFKQIWKVFIIFVLNSFQTFLGMVQLEYQARVDMVQLIDLLEKACIRFVHFSKENELRFQFDHTNYFLDKIVL